MIANVLGVEKSEFIIYEFALIHYESFESSTAIFAPNLALL